MNDEMKALVGEWHDMNEAGCCDDDGPFCVASTSWAFGYICGQTKAENAAAEAVTDAPCASMIGYAKVTCVLPEGHTGNHANGTGLQWISDPRPCIVCKQPTTVGQPHTCPGIAEDHYCADCWCHHDANDCTHRAVENVNGRWLCKPHAEREKTANLPRGLAYPEHQAAAGIRHPLDTMDDPEVICPHCGHLWIFHDGKRCDCGCMWAKPKPPPEPPTERDLMIARIEDVIWTELERQADEGIGPYVDREMDMVDASGAGLDMTAVAAAVAAALGLT